MREALGRETMYSRFMDDLFVMLGNYGVFSGSNESYYQIFQTLRQLSTNLIVGSQIKTQQFLGKLEFEMNKMVALEIFYIKLKGYIKQNEIELADIFIKFGADP